LKKAGDDDAFWTINFCEIGVVLFGIPVDSETRRNGSRKAFVSWNFGTKPFSNRAENTRNNVEFCFCSDGKVIFLVKFEKKMWLDVEQADVLPMKKIKFLVRKWRIAA
jgi:hypothetical protein